MQDLHWQKGRIFCKLRNKILGFVPFLLCVRTKRRSFQGKSSGICQSLKGYLPRQSVILCCLSGEPFSQEEMEDMLAVALDPETNTLRYRDYLKKLVVDETKTFPFNV